MVQPPVLGEVETQASIYERIGGHELIEATLLSFLKKTSVDPKIQKWFGKVPQDINSGEMRSLMIIGFGGPNHEESLALKESWTPFLPEGLSKNDFSTMLNLFSDAMRVCAKHNPCRKDCKAVLFLESYEIS